MGIQFLEPAELEHKAPEKVITLLFGYKQRLLDAARDDEEERKIIFDRRLQIAEVFKKFGGERHLEVVQLFEGLMCPDDILRYSGAKRSLEPKKNPEGRRQRPFGYHLFGSLLSDEERTMLKAHVNKQGIRMGAESRIDVMRILHLLEETYDGRPVYVSESAGEKIIKQLVAIVQINPNLTKRIFVLKWDGEVPSPQPITEHPLFQKLSTQLVVQDEDIADKLRRFIYHEPKVGDIFHGVVSRTTDFGAFVQILPEVEGLLSNSEIPRGLELQNDDIVDVIVTEVGRHGIVRLSMTKAQERIKEGERPLFEPDNSMKLLLSGNAEEVD